MLDRIISLFKFDLFLRCWLEFLPNAEFFSQFILLSKYNHKRRLHWVQIQSKFAYSPFKNLLLPLHLISKNSQFSYALNRLLPFAFEGLVKSLQLFQLLLIKLQICIELMRPLLMIPLQKMRSGLFCKEVNFPVGTVHEIAMHGREERVGDLFEAVVEFGLPLRAIGSDSALNKAICAWMRSRRWSIVSRSGSSTRACL